MSKITIYKTKTMKEAAECVMDALSRVDKKRLDVLHTVIVPDRASLEAERALLKALADRIEGRDERCASQIRVSIQASGNNGA